MDDSEHSFEDLGGLRGTGEDERHVSDMDDSTLKREDTFRWPCCRVDSDGESSFDVGDSSSDSESCYDYPRKKRSRPKFPPVRKPPFFSAKGWTQSMKGKLLHRDDDDEFRSNARQREIHTLMTKKTVPIRQAAAQAKKAKWTECIAAAHILQDEVRGYLDEKATEVPDPDLLALWTGKVTKDLVEQNAHVLENLDAITSVKVAQLRVNSQRSALTNLRNDVLIHKRQQQTLRIEIEKQRSINRDSLAASEFLKHIDRVKRKL